MAMPLKRLLNAAKWAAIGAAVLLGVAIVLGIAGYGPQAPRTDITAQRPYADYVGREYRIAGDVSACAWNDFPDKDKILTITLPPSVCAANRFVSYRVPIARGKRIRIVRAWRSYYLFEIRQEYVVSVAGVGLPPDVEIKVEVGDDGVLDRRFYESVDDQ
jgi:hypothetical protein